MLKVTDIDFHDACPGPARSGWYLTDGSGALIGDANRYDSLASGLRALTALCG